MFHFLTSGGLSKIVYQLQKSSSDYFPFCYSFVCDASVVFRLAVYSLEMLKVQLRKMWIISSVHVTIKQSKMENT